MITKGQHWEWEGSEYNKSIHYGKDMVVVHFAERSIAHPNGRGEGWIDSIVENSLPPGFEGSWSRYGKRFKSEEGTIVTYSESRNGYSLGRVEVSGKEKARIAHRIYWDTHLGK